MNNLPNDSAISVGTIRIAVKPPCMSEDSDSEGETSSPQDRPIRKRQYESGQATQGVKEDLVPLIECANIDKSRSKAITVPHEVVTPLAPSSRSSAAHHQHQPSVFSGANHEDLASHHALCSENAFRIPSPHAMTTGPSEGSVHRTTERASYPSQTHPLQQGSTQEQFSEESSIALHQAQSSIEIDDYSSSASPISSFDTATDAGYESDSVHSASTSLASSIRDFAFENGRRYHRFREGSYNFPNDDPEQDREDMKHAMVVMLCGRLHFAPVNRTQMKWNEGMDGIRHDSEGNGRKILDMGTGTGIWAIEMGDLYPGASITGVDLSPIQPAWVPPNVEFVVDDLESAWLRPPDYFDYIHGRNIVMGIRDWPKLMRTALEHLKPGGWLELQEVHHYPYCHDDSLGPNHPLREFWANISGGLAVLGVNFEATLLLEGMMVEAGFTNVSTRIFQLPIGVWPKNRLLKTLGLWWRTILLDGAQPIAMGPMTRGLKWSREQVEVWLIGIRKAYWDQNVHSFMPLHIICGQKPEVGQ